jgi:hypothetical protein
MNTKRMLGCLIGLVLLAAACGQKDSTAPARAASNPAAPSTSAPPVADPLRGQWRQEFTCQDVVRTLQRAGFAEVAPEFLQTIEGAAQPPSSVHLCAGAPSKFTRIARFQDGRLVLFEGPAPQQVGLDASYEIVDDHTFTASDAGQNINGTYTFNYRLKGDRLTVDVLQDDAFFIATWESVPFHRTS